MDVGYILRRAWPITWHHKALWLFGLLVGLGTASTRFGMVSVQWDLVLAELPPEIRTPITEFIDSPYLAVVVIILVVFGLAVGFGLMLLNTLGRIGLVHQARAAEEYGVIVLRGGWRAGKQYLWKVFTIRLLLGLSLGVLIVAGALPSIVTQLVTAGQDSETAILGDLGAEVFRLVCEAPAWCIAALLSVPLGLLQRLAVRACVLENLDTRGSLASAWEMLREHLGAIVLVWSILFGIGACVLLVLGLPLGATWLLLLSIARLAAFASPMLSAALALLIGVSTWLVLVLIIGVAETFSSATWTLAYRELTGIGRTGEEGGCISVFGRD
jgi:hypothetical protein